MAARDTTRSLSWLLDAARDSRKKCRSKRCQSRARPEVPFQPAFYEGRPLEYTRAACSRIGTGFTVRGNMQRPPSLTEEAAPETGQYHLHEQIGEGACERLPLEFAHAVHRHSLDPDGSTGLIPLCPLQLGLSIERRSPQVEALSSPSRSSAATELVAGSQRTQRALLPALQIAALLQWRG